DGPDRRQWKDIGRQRHDEAGPGLLAEEGNAEKCEREAHRNVRYQDHSRHECGAQTEHQLAREVEGVSAPQKITRKPASQKTAQAGCGIRDPGKVAYVLDIVPARIVEIFW